MLQEALEIHDYLNPALWTKNDELLPEVEDRLNKIVSKFQSECMLPLDIVDVHLVGSNASYNYNKYSDLDVHIVVNFDLLDVDKEILIAAYNLQKAQFNRDYDISIHGVNVEMYIEDINAGTMSNGIYSLYNKKWIKKPQKVQYPKLDARFDETVKKLADKIEDTLQNGCSVAVTKMINMLYMMRKNALATDGEFGVGNLIFKEIRNLRLLDQLKDRLKELQSQDLTLEQLNEDYFFAFSKSNPDKDHAVYIKAKNKEIASRIALKELGIDISDMDISEVNSFDIDKSYKMVSQNISQWSDSNLKHNQRIAHNNTIKGAYTLTHHIDGDETNNDPSNRLLIAATIDDVPEAFHKVIHGKHLPWYENEVLYAQLATYSDDKNIDKIFNTKIEYTVY